MENKGKIYDDTPDLSTGFVSTSNVNLELKARMKSCIRRSEEYVRYRDGFLESLCNLVTTLVRIKGSPLFCLGYRSMYKPSEEEWLVSASFGVYGIDVYNHSGDPIFYYDERIHEGNGNIFIMGHNGYKKVCKKLAEVGPDRVNDMKWGELLGHGFPVEVHYGFIKDIPPPERFYDWINTVLMRDPEISKHLS